MDQATESTVLYEVKDRIATITLNRPEKLNAFNDDMMKELIAAFDRFDMDDEALTAILCGKGRAFSSGADVRQRQMKSREELEKGGGPSSKDAKSADIYSRSINWKPIICATQGYAVGLGTGLAVEADMLVAEAGCKFQITETNRGLAGSGKLMDIMAYRGMGSFATDVTLTGRFFTAEEAARAGVVDRVAPAGKLMETAIELANQINSMPPLAVRANVMLRRWEIEERKMHALRYASLNKLYLTEDFREAARSFVEKRKPGPWKAR